MFVPITSGSAVAYKIDKSLRIRSGAYLSRTFGTANLSAVFSFWVKRGTLGTVQTVFGYSNGTTEYFVVQFKADNTLDVASYSSGYTARRSTTKVFRDPSAWYHICIAIDSANTTPLDRMRVDINGVRETTFNATVNQAQNQLLNLTQSTWAWSIGRMGGTADQLFDGYLSNFYFIVGQPALSSSNFGQVSSSTGAFIPKRYSGSYGAEGFFLPFSDGSNLTALTSDASGNGNNWTATNISLAAGITYDWVEDTPTNNFTTLNSLAVGSDATIAAANLAIIYGTGATISSTVSTVPMLQDKLYLEYVVNVTSATNPSAIFGVQTTENPVQDYPGLSSTSYSLSLGTGNKINNSSPVAYGSAFVVNDIAMMAVDIPNRKIWWGKNGVWFNSGNPALGTNEAYSGIPTALWASIGDGISAQTFTSHINYGQRPFVYTPPSGFTAHCTKNISEGTITLSGSFQGNASANGPNVFLNGVPLSMTINGNAVTWGTHADKTAYGFKVRTASASYNVAGSNTFVVSVAGSKFKYANAQLNS